jgi:hypothetical protein
MFRRANQPLSPRRLLATRLALPIVPILAITLSMMNGTWGFLILVFFPIFELSLMPTERRRQILGRRRIP